MNQILVTKSKNKIKKKNWFKLQFLFSTTILLILIISLFIYFQNLQKEEKFSKNLIANYNIYRLYSSTKNQETKKQSDLFGIIEIPKINIYYPVFSYMTENILKTAPCKIYGAQPYEYGNICIAGHNYDNSLFFSKISSLSSDDQIVIYDINNNKYIYHVYKIYEVLENDVSPIFDYKKNEKILTLITCNNLNQNRIIVKAKQK